MNLGCDVVVNKARSSVINPFARAICYKLSYSSSFTFWSEWLHKRCLRLSLLILSRSVIETEDQTDAWNRLPRPSHWSLHRRYPRGTKYTALKSHNFKAISLIIKHTNIFTSSLINHCHVPAPVSY